LIRRLVFLLLFLVAACEVDIAPLALRMTPAGTGPVVRFDPTRDMPLPSDLATAPDPTSRTGRRPSLSGSIARELRADLDAMEGWGVTQPITVGFDHSATTDVRLPAIDVEAALSRMADEHDPANDPFYVVNLSTGIPALVDVGAGYHPLRLRDSARYAPADPKGSERNLLFETVEEGADLPFFAYTTARDRDFDGVLDHPNRYDWYERETDTLILRPIVPLAEATEYAVVLTDRLRSPSGEPVRSPFEAIHHPTQRSGVARLRDWLTDHRLVRYYGDIAGTGLDHVAFAWTFTTAPAREDLRVVREGLYGRGPLARIDRDFPADVKIDASNGCAIPSSSVDRILTGTFDTPKLIGDGPDGRFAIDFQNGGGAIAHDTVQWVLVVPKPTRERKAPFPVVVWMHDDDAYADDAEVYGADYARQGLAFLAFNRPGFGPTASHPVTGCVTSGRGDNAPWWSGHVAHDRDRLRQAAIDAMSLVRIADAKKLPDIGGPIYVAGAGVGGIVASLVGATEPNVAATAPIASGGSLADAALRSSATNLDPILGPFVSAVPNGTCLSVRLGDTELACVPPHELGGNVTVLVTNVTKNITRCALTEYDGRFSIAIPTDVGDRLDVQVYDAPEVVGSYATCRAKHGAPVGRRIQTFEQKVEGHEVGDRLVATHQGLGLRRQSPELRRFRDLAQALLDASDPAAFAARFMLEPIGAPRPVLATATVGDAVVPIASQLAFARAAGALPFLPPSAVERLPAYADYATPRDFYDRLAARTPMRFLVESGTAEGFARTGGGPACKTNDTCAASPTDVRSCASALFDPDWTSEGDLPYDEPHPDVPLRLARIASLRTTDSTSLAASWEPRLSGVPFAPDATGWTATQPIVGLWMPYVEPGGAHAWSAGSTCRVWDPATYGSNLVARFLATSGRDLYYLSHPSSHGCLATSTCDLFQ
jgi:outer membrane lipoprotein SlyB